ncbi:putative ribonucleoside-diphosphate reductase 1 subunit alpha [Escherichia phage vB_EcoM_G2248]|nr:putative ribonucleoside-diphosphate reductase 1 subunit alpha [Escherichia phage vB_EcoM_G2248]
MIKNVVKSSGLTVPFEKEKVMKILEAAAEGHNVDPYELFDMVEPLLTEGMSTNDIQKVLIKVAADNITVETPDYQYVASNLAMFALRKSVYGQFQPIDFYSHIESNIATGKYDREILQKYSREEVEYLEKFIDHKLDFKMTYAGAMQLKEKYLVQDRSTKKIIETPQFAYMLIGMCLHQEETENRLEHVIDFYNAVANKQISLPTPIMAGVRTPTRQFSSCVVIESDDSLPGINETANAIIKYISKRAGIGINAGMIRAEGSKIGHGEVRHTGVIPFWKHFQTAVKSCSQGGIRGGAATLYYPMWHLEFESLIVLKNNKGVEDNRIRHLDYGVQINNLMVERFLKRDYITLFSPDVAGGLLWDLYFRDEEGFRQLYEKLEKDPSVRKTRVKAEDLFLAVAIERFNTGRIYPAFTDNMNNHGAFIRNVAPIKQSNLCCEIALPTKPMGRDDSEISLCTLAAYVLGNFDIENMEEVERIAMVMVRALDNLLDYQDYPVEQALTAKKRRSLGVGVTNFASYLADNFFTYEDANEFTHKTFERLQYALIKASVRLAKEKGACELMHETRYGRGELPIDWYKKTVDELVDPVYEMDWEELREDLKKYGIRNSTLSALMPCESSSQVSNSTNGIEPPRGIVSVKGSKEGQFNQVIPNVENNADVIDLLWTLIKKGNKPYLTLAAIMQKFVDQAISSNTSYDPSTYKTGKVDIADVLDDMLFAQHYGLKTLYYANVRDGADGTEDASECSSCKL